MFRYTLLPLVFGACILPNASAIPTYQWQARQLSEPPADWQKYVRAPATTTVLPARILSNFTEGNVTNEQGLLTTGSPPTIFNRPVPAVNGSADVIPSVVVDFGQNIVGFLSINFGGASNSTAGLPGIRLAFSETIQYGYLTNLSDFTSSDNGDTITPGSDQIAVLPDPFTWVDVHDCDFPETLQVCSDGIHGFRYVNIYMDALPYDEPLTSSYGEVKIDSMSLNFTAFLGTPDTFTGWFESSDEDLNQWWFDAAYTNEMDITFLTENTTDPRDAWSDTLADQLLLIDGAKRDRDCYVGDIAVSGRTAFLTHDAAAASRNVLADLAYHQRADGWIPPASINDYTLPLLDYPLHWVTTSFDLYMYTNDVAYIQQYYQTMINVLDNFYPSITDNRTNLLTKGLGVSGSYGDYAFLGRTGPVTYYNALYVIALNNAASIATFLGGHDEDAARWTARAQRVSKAINEFRFDESVGAYFDGTCGNISCPTHAQDGNSLAIVCGAADSTRAASVLSYLAETNARPFGNVFYDNDVIGDGFSDRVYAFISYFELEARFIAGQPETALEQIRRTYSFMANNGPGITMWEGVQDGLPYEQGFTSMAHGWSTGIVPALQNYVVGVLPTSPGFKTFTVKPMPGDIQWVKGQVPTPSGPINVYWNNSEPGRFYLTVSSPAGTTATVSVPANSTSSFFVDGQMATDATTDGVEGSTGYVSVVVEGGEQHTISVGFDGSTTK